MTTPTTGTDVRGVNITMTAGLGGVAGGIGTPTNWLEIDVDVLDGAPARRAERVRHRGGRHHRDRGHLPLRDRRHPAGRHRRHPRPTWRCGRSTARSWTPGTTAPATTPGTSAAGRIDLDANGGSIGNPNGLNDLEIDSSISGRVHLQRRRPGGVELDLPDRDRRATCASSWRHAENGNIRLTVRESAADTDEDLLPDPDRLGAVHRDAAVPTARGTSRNGIDLRQRHDPGRSATCSCGSATTSTRTRTAGSGRRRTSTSTATGPTSTRTTARRWSSAATSPPATWSWASNSPPYLTNIWGDTDVDTIQFGDPTGIGMTNTLGSAGYIHLGSQTRVHGSDNLSAARRSDDGEDRILVFFLQSMNVGGRPHPHPRRPGRHRLLHDLHHRQPRERERRPELRDQHPRHRRPERRRRRGRDLRHRQHRPGVQRLHHRHHPRPERRPVPAARPRTCIPRGRRLRLHRRQRDRRPARLRGPAPRLGRPRYADLVAEQRADHGHPAGQLRPGPQRPAVGLRPGRQRPLLRRRHDRDRSPWTAAPATTPSRSARSSAPSATRPTAASGRRTCSPTWSRPRAAG